MVELSVKANIAKVEGLFASFSIYIDDDIVIRAISLQTLVLNRAWYVRVTLRFDKGL